MRLDGRPPTTTVLWPLGDTVVFVLLFRNRARRAVSRDGSTWLGQIKEEQTDPLVDAVATFNFDTAQADEGTIRAVVPHADTETLVPSQTYFWDIEEIDAAGEKRTRAAGTIVFEQDTSRAA